LLANPFPVTSAKNDAVLNELARLGISTPIPPKNVKQGRQMVELSESERGQLARYEGEQLRRRMGTVLATDFWERLPDERKVKAIQKWRQQIDRSRPFRLVRMRSENGPREAAVN
jgi:hypothetical protein